MTAASSIETLLAEVAAGRTVLLVDDTAAVEQGVLLCAGASADADAVNFMAREGRGLICLALTQERVRALGLPPMTTDARAGRETAFTVSIEAVRGVTTGISAADRARTIAVAIDPQCGRGDLATPGHVFPVSAHRGGVLAVAGVAEAAVDLARLAGAAPAGVICEVLNDDGAMAGRADLAKLASRHRLKLGLLSDLIDHRRRVDMPIELIASAGFDSVFGGGWSVRVYRNSAEGTEHLVLIKGGLCGAAPMPVRLHRLSLFADVLGEGPWADTGLQAAMTEIGEIGRGVVVIIRETLISDLADLVEERSARSPAAMRRSARDRAVGAHILRDLGLRSIALRAGAEGDARDLARYGLAVLED